MQVRKIDPQVLCHDFDIDRLVAIEAFRQLAEQGPVDGTLGICNNFSGLAEKDCRGDGYGMVDSLFAAALEVDRRHVAAYPIKPPAEGMWESPIRQKWCEVFADALETGVMNITEKLYATLKEPVE